MTHSLQMPDGRLLMAVSELADTLNVSVRQCWRMRDSGELPQPLQIGGRKCLRWRRDEILAWLAAGAPHVRKTGWRYDDAAASRKGGAA